MTRRRAQYYFHRFYDFQPDLDMANPQVREEVRRVIGYWLQLGVAGFRVDAVPFVHREAVARRRREPTLNFDWLHEIREFLQWRVGNAVLLGEANVLPQDHRYFGDGDGLHMMFNFWVNQHLFWRWPPATRSRWRGPCARPRRCPAGRSGRTSCATTTSSISAV